jgi:DNA-binding NarL/FixJ family response regulator
MADLNAPLKILVLEDDPADAELIEHTLRRADRSCEVHSVTDESSFVRALESFDPHVVLSDHGVAGFECADALRTVQTLKPECAFLVVSGGVDLTTTTCLRSGAVDFIHKSELSRLYTAIQIALRERASFLRLSDRQRQVLCMLAAGASTKSIASRLGVSVKTVETHRSQAMKRLGLGDIASVVRYAVRLGIVSAMEA